jgi:hypothetical protein
MFSTSFVIRVSVLEPLVVATDADTVSTFEKTIEIKAPRIIVMSRILL